MLNILYVSMGYEMMSLGHLICILRLRASLQPDYGLLVSPTDDALIIVQVVKERFASEAVAQHGLLLLA